MLHIPYESVLIKNVSMETNKKRIYFLCPGIEWDKPSTGGLLYSYVFINALKKHHGDGSVTPLNLIGDDQTKSWGKMRIAANINYLKFFLGKKLGKSDLVLVDSRANSLLLLPLIFLRCFSQATTGMMVYHINYNLSDRQGFAGIIEKYCEKLFICCASFIITISRSTLRDITQLTGRSEFGKIPIRIVSPGLKTESVMVEGAESIAKSPSEKQLLYVGTCEDPRKGLDYLIRATAGLPHSHFRLYLVGKYNETSSYHRRLTQIIQECNLSKKVLFLGRVSDEKLHQLYRESDIFVFPSLWEGYGIVLAEAMAHGLPVVATNVSAIPEIVRNGENGILVPPGNVEALTEALAELLDNAELRQQLADKSIEIAKSFKSWDEVGQDLAQLVDELCN